DTLWGVNRRKKGGANTLAALRPTGPLARTAPLSVYLPLLFGFQACLPQVNQTPVISGRNSTE
ncbi:hypothetical protein ACFWJI_42355, partial [Streptomyces griseorubiginosus]